MTRGTAAERVVPAPLVASRRQRRLLAGDRILQGLALASAMLILLIALIFIVALFLPALPAIRRFGLGFFVTRTWDPVRQIFGALPALYGTLVTSAIGIVIAFPIGLGAALFLAEEARLGFLRGPLSFAVELLAGIPSVVIGLWAFFLVTPLIRGNVAPSLMKPLGLLSLCNGTANANGYLQAVV